MSCDGINRLVRNTCGTDDKVGRGLETAFNTYHKIPGGESRSRDWRKKRNEKKNRKQIFLYGIAGMQHDSRGICSGYGVCARGDR